MLTLKIQDFCYSHLLHFLIAFLLLEIRYYPSEMQYAEEFQGPSEKMHTKICQNDSKIKHEKILTKFIKSNYFVINI